MRNYLLILFVLSIITLSQGACEKKTESRCGGDKTTLITANGLNLFMCHAPYTKIDTSKLGEWQNCDDGMFYIESTSGSMVKEKLINECVVTSKMEFRIQDNSLKLRHYYAEYPGFKEKPKIIESFDIVKGIVTYKIVGRYEKRTKEEIDKTIMEIENTIAKPFDGKTYFSSMYTNLYKLRDYAVVDPQYSLTVLRGYQEKRVFDGEVSETLSNIIEEVELISKAVGNN